MKKSLPAALLAAAILLTGCASDTESSSANSAEDSVAASSSEAAEAIESAAAEEPEPVETEAPPPPPPPATTNQPVGSTINVETSEGGSMQVQVVQTKTSKGAPDEYSEPPANGVHLGLLVQYACTVGPCDYNPFDWGVRGPDGTQYDQAFTSELFGQDLQSGTLQSGVPARGWVTFDVPPGTMSVEYTSNIFDGDVASWSVPVA